jgi:hypothetical protein
VGARLMQVCAFVRAERHSAKARGDTGRDAQGRGRHWCVHMR